MWNILDPYLIPDVSKNGLISDQLVTQNDLLRPSHHAVTAFPSPSMVTSASIIADCPPSTSLASPDVAPHEALNLSINNRCTPTTSPTASAGHQKVSIKCSWSPDFSRSTQLNDYRSRRDSADSSDQLTSSSIKSEDVADEAGKERRRRQKLTNKDNLFCQVCGDKANGYNFGAITCESCKAFFRRNAQKNKDLKCNFENACKIDHFTRKFCTACRLNKCFSVNMKKEWILDEDALKKRKKLTRRSTKEETSSNEFDYSFFPTFTTSQMYGASSMPLLAHPSALFMYMDPALATGSGDHNSEDKDYPPSTLSEDERAEIDRIVENHAMIDSPSSASSTPTTPTIPQPIPINQRILENHATVQPATASINASDQSLPQQDSSQLLVNIKTEPLSEPFVVVHPEDPPDDSPVPDGDGTDEEKQETFQPDQILNMAGDFISRLIRFVRFLPEFSDLSQRDQVALLKGGIMETLVIRSAIVYEEASGDGDHDDHSSHREDKPRSPPKEQSQVTKNMVSEHMKFIKRFNAVAKWDKVTMILGMIVNLFSADRPDLQDRDSVARAAQRYAFLLQAYLRSKYTFSEARTLYPQIILTLSDVRAYGEVSSQQMVKVSLSDLEPLMRDMFSMR